MPQARSASNSPVVSIPGLTDLGTKQRLLGLREEAKYRIWAARSAGASNRRRLEELRGAYRGRRCFIMGNGPSLLQCDISLLGDEVTIASNAHFLIWPDLPYRPTFLTVEDVLVAEDRAGELRDLTGTTRVFPFDLHGYLGEAQPDKLYLPFKRFYRPFPQFSFDAAKEVFWGGTVSFLNIQLAAYLGCTEIILIGFDHNYVVPERDADAGHVIESDQADVNHIHPDYFGPGYRWHDPNVARMSMSYELARTTLETRGIRVVNATVGGHLEVFPRVDYTSLFG